MGKLTARAGRIYLIAALAALLGAVALVGCGGGGSSSSSTSTAESSTTEEAGSATTTDSIGGEFAALEEVISAAEAEPTTVGVTQALPSKPTAGKTVVWLNCDVTQCQTIGAGMKEAADAAGWNFKAINWKEADSATLLSAMKEALEMHPVAVAFSGPPEAIWAQMIPAYEEAGVGMIPMFVGPLKESSAIIGNIDGPADNEYAGKVLADWFIVNSQGEGNAAVQAVPGFPVVTLWQEAFEAEVSKECAGCGAKTVETSVAEIGGGTGTGTMVSALQADTALDYAMTYNGVFIPGLDKELTNAGLGDVQLGGYLGTSDFATDMVNGSDYAFLGLNTEYSGWLALDYALRKDEKTQLDPSETLLPAQLITINNATPELAKITTNYNLPTDYQAQFKKLWGVG